MGLLPFQDTDCAQSAFTLAQFGGFLSSYIVPVFLKQDQKLCKVSTPQANNDTGRGGTRAGHVHD